MKEEVGISEKRYQPGEHYEYPLIIKKLLNTPLIYSPEQEIVYKDKSRYTYRELVERIHRLANGLKDLGINAGDTVAVFDYDSNRYLEAFFAVPMMGAVLQTVNWRLSAEQIVYTLNHAEAKTILINCVPTILQMIVTNQAVKQFDLSNWKVIIGGSKLPKGLAAASRKIGISTYTGYGMSETCPIISLATTKNEMADWDEDRLLDVVIKTGLPFPLVEFEVVNSEDRPLPHDGMSAGEVVFRTPWLTRSYAKAPDKSEALWQNGWLHSGDVGHIDERGYLQITDRIKDVIKSGGEWVSSLDLENLLSQHEAVLESAAIGVPDEKWGERPLMIVMLKPDYQGKVTVDDLKQYMKKAAGEGKLPKYGVPDRYEFVEEIAKTSVGKLDKKLMRQMYP